MKIADRKIEVYIGVYKGKVKRIINPTSRMILRMRTLFDIKASLFMRLLSHQAGWFYQKQKNKNDIISN
jgi:hypothetical protein